MKIALLILFIGASNALPAPQFLDFSEMNRQIAQQVAAINQQVADATQQVREQAADINQQVQEQITYAQNQADEVRRQAADAMESARQLGQQNGGNWITINEDDRSFRLNVPAGSSSSTYTGFENGVRICRITITNGVTGQSKTYTC